MGGHRRKGGGGRVGRSEGGGLKQLTAIISVGVRTWRILSKYLSHKKGHTT